MRPRNPVIRQNLLVALRKGPLSATVLAERLGVSGTTVLRLLRELGPQVCSAGAAGRTRHALLRSLRGQQQGLPVFVVDDAGRATEATTLSLIEPQGCCCPLAGLGWPVADEARDGWWEGLPYPLYDMQPQGYLGRRLARLEHQDLEVSEDPRDWSDDDIVFVLSRRGADTSGNLIVGEQAMLRWQIELGAPTPVLSDAEVPAAYPRLAEESAALGLAGSSAAGEFPKFTTLRELAGQATPHVITKFSGSGEPARRWSDLLVCEYLALLQVAELDGLQASRTRLVQAAGRSFLESERFDRKGRFGRLPVVSLHALNAHLLGLGTRDWRIHAGELCRSGLLSAADAAAVQRLWWFGRLIANGDMHLGNLSFLVAGARRLELAPAYDMLPMSYAPLPGGELPTFDWRPELPLPAETAPWLDACRQALAFWQAASNDERISGDFRRVCGLNAARLAEVAERV